MEVLDTIFVGLHRRLRGAQLLSTLPPNIRPQTDYHNRKTQRERTRRDL